MSRETRVRRTPATGRIPKRLSTATWLWPPPTSTMSVATGAGVPEFMFALFGIGEYRRPGTGSGRGGNGGRGWESNPPDTSHASHRI